MGLKVPYVTGYLTEHFGDDAFASVDGYRARGGYEGARKALSTMTPEAVIEEVKSSGLQGRGGAGFLTGLKWSFMPKGSERPKYLVCNADESEPGSFKDRLLLERGPHQMLEGILIAAFATGAEKTFVYVRGEYAEPARVLERVGRVATAVPAARAGAVFLAGAFLAGAFLAGAFLAGAFLAGAFLAGAFLAGAYLAGAYLAGAAGAPCASWRFRRSPMSATRPSRTASSQVTS
jgi:NADH-quinone oxidoreductase subunit F